VLVSLYVKGRKTAVPLLKFTLFVLETGQFLLNASLASAKGMINRINAKIAKVNLILLILVF
jgi:hypothetical protein